MSTEQIGSILDRIDAVVPAPLAQFDAFAKIPSAYKTRSESRGFLTICVVALCLLLSMNDIGEYLWGWPDYEFSVGNDDMSNFMNVNVDMIVNMPCRFLSVDLRDAVGDRLYLSNGFRREGTFFDIGQATAFKEHSAALLATQVVAQSRASRGFFAFISRWTPSIFRPKYNHRTHGRACRIFGSLQVKKVTANLHVTTAGHGYAGAEHTDHRVMNLSHVITEISFGPYFPDITQPLDYSFEVTHDPFVSYQYFLHVVPTTYIAPRSTPLRTNQYSVTHYVRKFEHGEAIPGIFFKFDIEPLSLTIHQRTTTFMQLLIRCVGVIGGVFVCTGYALRVTRRAVDVVTGADKLDGIVLAESTGVKVGLRQKWSGGSLRPRNDGGRFPRQGNEWVIDRSPSPSPFGRYSSTPTSGGTFSPSMQSPYLTTQGPNSLSPIPLSNTPSIGLGLPHSAFGPGSAPPRSPRSGSAKLSNTGATSVPTLAAVAPYTAQGTPSYAQFPPTPTPEAGSSKPDLSSAISPQSSSMPGKED